MLRLDQLPSFIERRLDFCARDGFILTNASVTTHEGQIVATVHATDHWMDDRGVWVPLIGGESRCRFADNLIYLAYFDRDLMLDYTPVDDGGIYRLTEITNDTLEPRPRWPFRGFEGSRLFSWEGHLWAGIATSGIINVPGDEYYLGRVAPTDRGHTFDKLTRLAQWGYGKNWMPHNINGRQWFHYWPGTLIGPHGERRDLTTRNEFATWHGGSPVIPFGHDFADFLAVVHDYDDVPGTFRRATKQAFMHFDATGTPSGVTPFRVHPTAQLEITTGMALHPDGKRLLISYGRDEADDAMPRQERAFIAAVDLDDLRGILL